MAGTTEPVRAQVSRGQSCARRALDASLWASEDWSAHDGSWENARLLAGILNKMYIRDRITAMISTNHEQIL